MFELSFNIYQIEKNIYVFWNLFLFVRMLIRAFVTFHNGNKYYNGELDKRANDNGK